MNHIDVKTGFSFLSAYGSIDQVIDRAKELGSDAVGMADFCSTWGHIPFWKACKKAELKPLFGVQIPVTVSLEKDARFDLVTLIANDQDGLKEQYEMLSLATSQFYYRPRLTWDQVNKIWNNTVIVNRITPDTIKYIPEQSYLAAIPEQGYLLSLLRKGDHKAAAAIGAMYPQRSDLESYQLVNAVRLGRKTSDVDASNRYMMRRNEYVARFKELGFTDEQISGWIDNAEVIKEACNAEPRTGKNVKPESEYTLEQWCEMGAKRRSIDLDASPYKERYAREIELIHEKGFTDYFLLIADLVHWAKQHMFVGPARGSSAGSLVCYLMGIVEVDPLEFDLLFERFIDLNRKDLPDIDIDFPDDQRDMVFDYIISKYGSEKVARIGTISVFKPKSALNDVGKCYNIPPWEIKKLTEVMVERSGGDARANMAIEDTINQFDVGKELLKSYPKIAMATHIEGHPRHTGQHAAGIIVADKDVNNYFAVNRRDGHYIGMVNKNDAEDIGLLKIDALGLKTLAVIQDCCEQVGLTKQFMYDLPLDDPDAYKVFQDDRVAGIFQFEGYAVRSLMRQMGVEEFNDIVALGALARPGPLHCGAANKFIERRTGQKDWEYQIPELKPHTSHTYGTIVYQEQIMSITRDLGDMSWQDVSALRKAMSKSLGEEFFNKFKEKFLKGTRKRGIKDELAIALWEDMCTFGSWAFNLSHAVSYGLISYWCAYLKSHYPLEFAVAHLKRTPSQDHVLRLLRELMKEGIEMIPFDPDISQASWSIKDGKIYGGFTAVRGVGSVSADKYLEARASGGENWIKQLTPAQRAKILIPNNTPWHDLNRLEKLYGDLYEDPDNYITEKTPKGVSGPVIKIEDIIEKAGEYCFIGTIKNRNLRDLNETQSLVKRGGQRVTHHEFFLNLVVEDDTSSILCTIDRWKYPDIGKPLMEQNADGQDFLIRGKIYNDGWRKIHIQKILRLSDEDGINAGTSGNQPGGAQVVEAD